MIIPVRCFSCGLVLADKYRWYQSEVRRRKLEKKERLDKVIYLNSQNVGLITTEGEVLNDLGLHNVCCRRHFITHVDRYWVNSSVAVPSQVFDALFRS
jgi:DNA-directed RNA polymerase I, II, and III subunit RPABC5